MKKITLTLCVLLVSIFSAVAQDIRVSGTVKDDTGAPMAGVAVMVSGTSRGVTSDAKGAYSIQAPSAGTLSFTFIGMKTVEEKVAGRNTINVNMVSDAEVIEDVVVIGYGTARKRDLTGSVASIGGDKIASIPVSNAAQALQGQVAGVSVVAQDGRPDAGIKIRVRGGGSITQSNDPLYVVDGFPVSNINDVPASQIENITILKDASSTAIYGARGANGVVLVTTKSPKVDRISVTYDGSYQIKTLPKSIDMLTGSEYVQFNWELYELGSSRKDETYRLAYAIGERGTQAFKNGIMQYDNVKNTNWMKEVYGKTTTGYSHNVNISGGNENTKYNVAYNTIDDDALKIESWYRRTNVSAKLSSKLAKGLTFNFDTRFSAIKVYGDAASTNSALYFTPVNPLGVIDGAGNPSFNMEADRVNPKYNPVAMIEDVYSLKNRNFLQLNASLSYEIIKGLVFKTEYGESFGWIKNYEYEGPLTSRASKGLKATIQRNERHSMRFVNTLNYNVQGLGENHRLDLLLGQELNSSSEEKSEMIGKDLPFYYTKENAFGMINQGAIFDNTILKNNYEVPQRMASFFGRVNYSLMDKYLFTATLRADGSSKFAPGQKWGYFPAAALGWRISGEDFMKNATYIDNLKLRVSYGQAGNDRIDDDEWRQLWKGGTGGYPFNNVASSYYQPSSTRLYNPALKWETTITRNVGLDFGFWGGRLNGSIEGYWNTTNDLLLEVDVPSYLGYPKQLQNVGQTSNKGIEISLQGDIIRKKDFTLSASFNIAMNKSKIEKLTDGMPTSLFPSGWGSTTITPYSDYLFEEGKQLGLIRGYITDGFYTTADFNYNAATKTYTLKDGIPNSVTRYNLPTGVSGSASAAYPGALKFKKIVDDNPAMITENDVTIIGNTNPKHIGGFNLNAVYKGFDAMLAFNWSYGNDIYNANKLDAASMTQNQANVNLQAEMRNRYRLFDDMGNRVTDPAALNALNANASIWYPYQNTRVVHSWGIEDGSFLRLNNVTLGYTLPQTLTKKILISRLRVYATAYNVWTWTKYTGLDPEVDGNASKATAGLTPGLDWNAYPKARTFTFGINVTF